MTDNEVEERRLAQQEKCASCSLCWGICQSGHVQRVKAPPSTGLTYSALGDGDFLVWAKSKHNIFEHWYKTMASNTCLGYTRD